MMSQNKIISDIFLPFQEHVNQEQDVREVRLICKETLDAN